MAKLITITGLDGAGKSSQIKLIQEFFEKKNLKVVNLHFPMYDYSIYGKMISKFLSGDFGENDELDPYFVANMYAMDRFNYKPKLEKLLSENDIVIIDRYVDCNVAFQCSKVDTKFEQNKLMKWIYDFEYDFVKLPRPNLTLFLDVPLDTIEERLNAPRVGEDREYLTSQKDIHEADINFQSRVRDIYLEISENIIKTTKSDNKTILTPEELFNEYKNIL